MISLRTLRVKKGAADFTWFHMVSVCFMLFQVVSCGLFLRICGNCLIKMDTLLRSHGNVLPVRASFDSACLPGLAHAGQAGSG